MGRRRTHNSHEPGALLLHAHLPLSLSLSLALPLVWLPEGLRRARTTPPLRVFLLREFRIWFKLIYFSDLGWIRDPRGRRRSSYVYEYYEARHLWHYSCCIVVVTSGSTWPWGRLRRLHHQCLCRNVIPAFGLRGYITDPLIITTLWGNFCFLHRTLTVVYTAQSAREAHVAHSRRFMGPPIRMCLVFLSFYLYVFLLIIVLSFFVFT
jgi:hypothetical protein